MKTIRKAHDYKIQFNGSNTYFIVDQFGNCHGRANQFR